MTKSRSQLDSIRAAAFDGTGRPWDTRTMLRDIRTLIDTIDAIRRGVRVLALDLRTEARAATARGETSVARVCERHAEIVERILER